MLYLIKHIQENKAEKERKKKVTVVESEHRLSWQTSLSKGFRGHIGSRFIWEEWQKHFLYSQTQPLSKLDHFTFPVLSKK